MHIHNQIATSNPAGGVTLGLIHASGVVPDRYPAGFEEALAARLAAEGRGEAPGGFNAEERRSAARDMLRNETYKPTGRGKPASEYLVRAAASGDFPRINALVDINNLVSLEERLPISLWDVELAASGDVVFRLGADGEKYVFNPAGQELALRDLVIGCAAPTDGAEIPMVSPIKDSQATKTRPETSRVAVAIYAPASAVAPNDLRLVCDRFAAWLRGCGDDVATHVAVAAPGETVDL